MDNFGYWLLVGFVVLCGACHGPYWTAGKYFPGIEICAEARRLTRIWFRRAAALVSAPPDGVSVGGFLSASAWPAVVGLNLVFLAQILEVVVPGGSPVDTPVGRLRFFALVTGVLFAAVQSLFGIFAAEARNRAGKVGFGGLLVLTIFIEMGLSAYRAWLIRGGRLPVADTLLDEIIGNSGIIFTTLLGLVIPAAHSALGYVAYPRFWAPAIGCLSRVSFALVLFTCAAFVWVLFAFHPVPPVPLPAWAVILTNRGDRLRNAASLIRECIGSLEYLRNRISGFQRDFRNIRPVDELRNDIQDLRDSVANKRVAWSRESHSLLQNLLATRSLTALDHFEDQLEEALTIRETGTSQALNVVGLLVSRLKQLRSVPRRIESCIIDIGKVKELLVELGDACAALQKSVDALQYWSADIRAILNGCPAVHNAIPKFQVDQIARLTEQAANNDESWDFQFANLQMDKCGEILDQADHTCADARAVLESADRAAQLLSGTNSDFDPPIPAHAADLDALTRDLDPVESTVLRAEKTERRRIERLGQKLTRKFWVLERRPRWLWVVRNPLGPYDPSVGLFPDPSASNLEVHHDQDNRDDADGSRAGAQAA